MTQTNHEARADNGAQALADRLSPADRRALDQLPWAERDLVARVMRQHPALSFATALAALRDAGM